MVIYTDMTEGIKYKMDPNHHTLIIFGPKISVIYKQKNTATSQARLKKSPNHLRSMSRSEKLWSAWEYKNSRLQPLQSFETPALFEFTAQIFAYR